MARARDVMKRVDGCVRENQAQDVLDVMDAAGIDFMPLVDNLGGSVRGAVTRSDLARIVDRFGGEGRVVQARPVKLPTIPVDAAIGHVASAVGGAPAYIVVEGTNRVAGVYQPPRGWR